VYFTCTWHGLHALNLSHRPTCYKRNPPAFPHTRPFATLYPCSLSCSSGPHQTSSNSPLPLGCQEALETHGQLRPRQPFPHFHLKTTMFIPLQFHTCPSRCPLSVPLAAAKSRPAPFQPLTPAAGLSRSVSGRLSVTRWNPLASCGPDTSPLATSLRVERATATGSTNSSRTCLSACMW
jgi:hypothetical protein